MELINTHKQYRSNKTTVFSCQYHIIFTPKFRRSVLINGIDDRLKQLILEQQSIYNYSVIEMEVMPDHVHLLLDIDPIVGVNQVVKKIKGYSSNILRKEFPELRSKLPCLWTRSKFISTVGSVSLETVKHYIENQKNV